MPEYVLTDLRIVLKYAVGSYSFGDIALTANTDQMYSLAVALNAFQTEPTTKILYIATNEVL